MAVAIPPSYPMFPGDTAQFTVTALLTDDVTPFDLTNATIRWIGKLTPESTATVLNKSLGTDVLVSSPPTGQITLWYRPIDTRALASNQQIYNYVTVTDPAGNVYTIEEFIVFLQD